VSRDILDILEVEVGGVRKIYSPIAFVRLTPALLTDAVQKAPLSLCISDRVASMGCGNLDPPLT